MCLGIIALAACSNSDCGSLAVEAAEVEAGKKTLKLRQKAGEVSIFMTALETWLPETPKRWK